MDTTALKSAKETVSDGVTQASEMAKKGLEAAQKGLEATEKQIESAKAYIGSDECSTKLTMVTNALGSPCTIYPIAIISGFLIPLKFPFGPLKQPIKTLKNGVVTTLLFTGLAWLGIRYLPENYRFAIPLSLAGISIVAKVSSD